MDDYLSKTVRFDLLSETLQRCTNTYLKKSDISAN